MSLDDLTKKPVSETSSAAKPRRSLAWLLPVGLVLGFLAILGLLFGSRLLPATTVKTAPVITIRAGESQNADLPEHGEPAEKGPPLFQASGWVEPDPYTIFVPTLVNGIVNQVHVLEGQGVKKGDLLATLIAEDAELELQATAQRVNSQEKKIAAHCLGFEIVAAEIQAAERKIEALQTELETARDISDRFARLAEGAASQQEITQARLATLGRAATLAEAEAEVPRLQARSAQIHSEKDAMTATLQELTTLRDTAKLALDRTQISAPIDGIVLRLHAAPGKKRMLEMDDPTSALIVELYDPEKLQARIDVPLNEAAALGVGQPVDLISDLLPDQTFTGTVTRIVGQADLQRNTLQAKVEIDNPDLRLRPDMLVRAKFFSTKSTSGENLRPSSARLATYVPEAALVSETEVWVVSPESTAEKRQIKLGTESREKHRLALRGLRAGEEVILPPFTDLEPGARLKPTPANP